MSLSPPPYAQTLWGLGRESAPFTLHGMRVEEGRYFKENPGVVTEMRENDAEAGKTTGNPVPALCPRKNWSSQRGRSTRGKAFVIASKDKGVHGHMESADVILAPHSLLASVPPQAPSSLSPQALASPRGL